MNNEKEFQLRIKAAGLRITPQRVIVLKALCEINHPTAEQITQNVRATHPNIATGTVYKILETFVDKGIIRKVETRNDVMRYDAIIEKHHHLQNENGDRIEDYFDDELYKLVKDYLIERNLPAFKVTDIKIQIIGKFNESY